MKNSDIKQIVIFLVFFSNIFIIKSQNINDVKVFVRYGIDYITDTLTFYNDSTFKYCLLNGGFGKHYVQTTTGKYSTNDSLIVIKSNIEYKRVLKVNEEVTTNTSRTYLWNEDSSSVYYGAWGYILEYDKTNQLLSDTLYFRGNDDFNLKSKHKDVTRIEIYVKNEYVGEYYFENKKSNNIKIWFSDHRHSDRNDIFYIREMWFILKNNELQCIRGYRNGLFFYKIL